MDWDEPSDDMGKLLFAEDLIGYIMRGFDRSYRYPSIAEDHRMHVVNPLTDFVRYAVVFLCQKFNRSNFLKYEVLRGSRVMNGNETEHLTAMSNDLYEKFFRKGFDARRFLFYCAQVSSMAGVFYVFGTPEAPEIAVDKVHMTIRLLPMRDGAWETLDAVAMEISKLDYLRICLCQVDRNLGREYRKCDSPPRCTTPDYYTDEEDEVDGPAEEELSPEDEVPINRLLTVDLRKFIGFDEAWRDRMIEHVRQEMVDSAPLRPWPDRPGDVDAV